MHTKAQTDTTKISQDSLKIRAPRVIVTNDPLSEGANELRTDSKKLQSLFHKKPKTDSTQLKISKPELKHDSVKLNVKAITNLKPDSTASSASLLLKKLKSVFPKGTMSLGYDYGFLPYTVNMPSPASAIKTEGRLAADIFNIPVNITYFYSSQKNLIGLNNYFRISYDADRYKEGLSNKLNGNLDSYKSRLGDLGSQRQTLLQKMAYTDYLSSIHPDRWPLDTTGKSKSVTLPGVQLDTSGSGVRLPGMDTTGKAKNNKYYQKADSLAQRAVLYKNKADSVAKAYESYKKQYTTLDDSIKRTQSKIKELESLINGGSASYLNKLPYFNKIQNFLSGVKKMDIGLCYPAYSTFLANNIPVRGINLEYQKNNRFFAFTYGTTVNTLLFNSKSADGVLQNVKNSYNYFGANNLSAGRKILSAKFGIGEKDGDHLFVGFLLGKGYTTYSPTNSNDITSQPIESNLVLEADIRKKLLKNSSLDVVLGKSSLQQQDMNMATLQNEAKELFSHYRSYAALVRVKTCIPATKSNLTFTVRWVDPFFNSFGVGFIRSDNLRYEVKLDQPLGKLFRYTVMTRYEEDNLLKLLNYRNTFYSVNNMLAYKIKKGLMLRAGYTPLLRTLNGENIHQQNRSSIVTGIITFLPKSRRVQMQFNVSYNYYQVNTDSTPINFQNFAYYHQFTFKSGFKTGLNVSWFKNNLKDSAGNNVFLAVLDAGYQFKNGSTVSVAGKSAYKLNGQLYPGFIVKSAVRISTALFWENQVEKFIVGDLFNGYDLQSLKRFPYCFSTKLILNF